MNQGLIVHLINLLYEHDCVIIPGFGGFLLQAKPTVLDDRRQHALPPCRSIRFNSLLKDDDGLLTSSLAAIRKTGYAEARNIVDGFTQKGWELLRHGRPWILEGIGTFTLNSENGLMFEPDPVETFLASSFGLTPVLASPALSSQPVTRTGRKPKDRKPERISRPVPAGARWITIGALPVMAFLVWGIISPFQAGQQPGSYAGFFIRHSATVTIAESPVTKVEPARIQELPLSSGNVETAEDMSAQTTTEEIPAPHPIGQDSGPRYYIIGGAFLNHDNALRFIEALKARGYNAETAGTTRSGQLRISYGSFPGMNDAALFLDKIRKEENPAAWILKY